MRFALICIDVHAFARFNLEAVALDDVFYAGERWWEADLGAQARARGGD